MCKGVVTLSLARPMVEAATVLLLLAGTASAQCPPATFQGIGVPTDKNSSFARAISDAGTIVVGAAGDTWPASAILWTEPAGLTTLPATGFAGAEAQGISADGSVVVGFVTKDGSPKEFLGVRWLTGGVLTPFIASIASASSVNGDGSVIAGFMQDGKPFRWTEATGPVVIPSTTSYGNASFPSGLSADGGVLVASRDWTWKEPGGYTTLSVPFQQAFKPDAIAFNVSADGQVAVGRIRLNQFTPGNAAARWVDGVGEDLGLPIIEGIDHYCSAANIDGSVVVGLMHSSRPLLWTEALGVMDLESVLRFTGADLTGWILTSANDVTSDGSTFVGHGTHLIAPIGFRTEGWIATLPMLLAKQPKSHSACAGTSEVLTVRMVGSQAPFDFVWHLDGNPITPGPRHEITSDGSLCTLTIHDVRAEDAGAYTCLIAPASGSCGPVSTTPAVLSVCYADCECDGDLDVFDFLCFQSLFGQGESYADCDHDDDWDVFDFLCFQGSFAGGCP